MNVLQHEQVGDIKALNTHTRPSTCSWQLHKHTSFSVKQADELINSPKYQEPVDPRSDVPTNVEKRVWAETKCAHFVTHISRFWETQTIYALNHFDPFMAVVIFIEGFSFSFTPFIPISFYYFFSSPICFQNFLRYQTLSLSVFPLLIFHLPLALTLHLHSFPALATSLSPTPSFAPRISPLPHGLASSLSISPYIYINEQMSSFHLPPDEQTLLVEEDKRKDRQNTQEHSFSQTIISAVASNANVIVFSFESTIVSILQISSC